jgi:hypothetical protein
MHLLAKILYESLLAADPPTRKNRVKCTIFFFFGGPGGTGC